MATVEYGNGYWRTQQGSSVVVCTDDNGIKTAVNMGCARNSKKTAINKYGKLYEVLPYEPSVTYVDGVAVLNNEPQQTNYELFSEPTSGGTNVSFESFNWGNGFTNCVRYIDNSVQRDYSNSTLTVSNTYTRQFYIIMDDLGEPLPDSNPSSGDLTIFIGANPIPPSNISKKDMGNGIWKISGYTSANTTGNSFIRKTTTQSNRGFRVVGLQVKDGITHLDDSYIRTNGATYTRLADTGFQTPDISKWVDSKNFTIELTVMQLINNTSSEKISLYASTFENSIEFDFTTTAGQVNITHRNAGSPTGLCTLTGAALNILNTFRLTVSGTTMTCSLNGGTEESTSITPFDDGEMKVLSLNRANVAGTFKGYVKELKIES